jgi:membrane protein
MHALKIAYEAGLRFHANDGWAIASHLALSALMALFPFMLVITGVAAILGAANLADEAARLMIEAWPKEVAGPVVAQLRAVVAGAHGGTLTVGAVLAVLFSATGVEALRIGLNRAYQGVERRSWLLLRLESIVYVLVGAIALLALSFLVVLAPLMLETAIRFAPWLAQFGGLITFLRFGVAGAVLVVALIIAHRWLPASRQRLARLLPGIAATLVLWLVSGAVFGRYLAEFAFTYAIYYAGLASVMIALVFLYFTSVIFLYGAELNAALARHRAASV